MECLRCGNKDPTYFYLGSKGMYCRKCISFKRILIDETPISKDYEIAVGIDDYSFDYELTPLQKEASKKTLEHLINGKDVLLECVCGAGKTEISVLSIAYFLRQRRKVCFAISRKEVVIELSQRFKRIFKEAKVVALYENHHDEIVGDLIVCTTHQLYRYYKIFDLLIIDECDAFPLNNNETLMNISLNSCKGNIIYSTATVNSFLNKYTKNAEVVKLYSRPSLKPLVVPKVIYSIKYLDLIILIYLLNRSSNQCIIFVSSVSKCQTYYKLLKKIFSITYAYAQLCTRNQNILDFKNKKYKFILSTTILERGITIKDIDVIIVYDYKNAFDEGSLIQMSGRVGRNIDNPNGNVYIITNNISKDINRCIDNIKEANKKLEMSLLR